MKRFIQLLIKLSPILLPIIKRYMDKKQREEQTTRK